MTASRFILPAKAPRDAVIAKLIRFAHQLDPEKAWQFTCERYKRKRSHQQNAYLWGCVYPTILEAGGEALRGWTADDLHEFFLIEHFGSEEITGFGRRRLKPVKRSSRLSTVEFMEFVEFIQQFMAEKGVYIPDPNEEYEPA